MQIVEITYPHGTPRGYKMSAHSSTSAGVLFFYFLMAVPFSVLNLESYKKNNSCQHRNPKHNVKSFHGYSSLSFGVTKYANTANSKNAEPSEIPTDSRIFPDNMLPITPAVRVYLAASANIFAITFLLSLFTIKVYLKEGINARG